VRPNSSLPADDRRPDDRAFWCGELEFAKHLRHLLATTGTSELPAEVRDRLDRFVHELAEIAAEGGTP
jgi:hypothetical protein